MLGPGGLEFNKVISLGQLKLTVEDVFGRKAIWTVKITMGSAKNLDVFIPRIQKEPGFIEIR